MVTGRRKAARLQCGNSLRKEAGYMWVSGVELASLEGSDGLLLNGHGNDGWSKLSVPQRS